MTELLTEKELDDLLAKVTPPSPLSGSFRSLVFALVQETRLHRSGHLVDGNDPCALLRQLELIGPKRLKHHPCAGRFDLSLRMSVLAEQIDDA